ncbi:PREDICTED: uncharacterized protein C4orf19 homolog [Galeopterus variegatus]|uniref:Uncharacterized protein C4orf19 homolog n=1 Tax=Galeopterus variegatus TaxID=482537 RepID=A0ABM0S6S4_GALVR|nr:PREDICTED: uncharacterized protein C4orf19 homolog [Galeopterus variegatus]
MGCRCCKMIQSYLFDPVQVPSPGYVNEVSSYKLDEDTVKLKGKQSNEVLVHKNDLQSEGLKRTESRGKTAVPQALPQGDTGGGHCADKTGTAANGISPAAVLQPPEGSGAGPANNVHPTQPFLEEEDSGKQGCVLPALEETPVMRNGDSRAPSKAQHLAWEVQDHVFQIPAPDYPQLSGPAVDNVNLEKKDFFQIHTEDEPLEGICPRLVGHDLNMPFSMKRSWDSLNEAVATEVLSVCFKEEGPGHAVSVDSRDGQKDTYCSSGDGGGEMVDEDAAVAEALAALEAATAGEDVDEAD